MQNNNLFTVVIPGSLPLSFSQENDYFVCDIMNPGQVQMITLTINQAIPDDHACTLYYSLPPYQCVEYLVAVANQRPSDIVPSGFPLNSDINTLQILK